MPLQPVLLGVASPGADGDSHRAAWEKGNANFVILNGSVPYVAGGAGFVNVSGAVTLDLSLGRSFHHTMVGNITSLAFSNIPSATEFSSSWTWVLTIDATGGYILSSTPTVTWIDGASFTDLDLSANAVNIVTFWQVGSVVYAALLSNGTLAFDPYKVCFLTNATVVVMTEAEEIDVANDTQNGDGVITYAKNGTTITVATVFAEGDRLSVICAGATGTTAVRIPRYAL